MGNATVQARQRPVGGRHLYRSHSRAPGGNLLRLTGALLWHLHASLPLRDMPLRKNPRASFLAATASCVSGIALDAIISLTADVVRSQECRARPAREKRPADCEIISPVAGSCAGPTHREPGPASPARCLSAARAGRPMAREPGTWKYSAPRSEPFGDMHTNAT